MKRINNRLGLFTLLLNIFAVIIVTDSVTNSQNAYESAFLYITDAEGHDYPHDATPGWGDDGDLTNGITHDDDNWYISSISTNIVGNQSDNWTIYRIPVSEPLDQNTEAISKNPLIKTISLKDIPLLKNLKYTHIGDMDCFKKNGIDFLLAPLTDGPGPVIAFFRAATLTFIGYSLLSAQKETGWCAVTPEGELISSDHHPTVLQRYSIPWDLLTSSPYIGEFSITYKGTYPLLDESGSTLMLHHMQGGDFTPGGELLYVNCGIIPYDSYPTDGINVFNTSTWKRIQSSIKSWYNSTDPPPYFIYEFDNGFDEWEEPEGLTIWDLDDGRAPNVRGQLHVILYDHNPMWFLTNRVHLKHYTQKVYVDNASSPPQPKNKYNQPPIQGTPEKPFDTVNNAFNWYPIWDGAEIVIKAGTYPETGIFSKRVRLISQGGAVIIGK